MTRRHRVLLVLLFAAIALLIAGRWLSRPSSVAVIVTNRLGASLGLEISAGGTAQYRLRGTPMLVLREVSVREPGAAKPLLTAHRIYVALPWSTLRAGGKHLVARRIELDTPHLDLPALQRWLATRPPSEKRLPTLTDGLRIRDGAIDNNDWRIDGIHADMRVLDRENPLRARLRGRYLDASLAIPVDLAVAIVHPEALIKAGTTTGFATHGRISIERGRDWRLPATLQLSGPLRIGADDLRITPARLGMAARLETATTQLPFALGLYGPLHFDEATWTLAPAGLALRPRGDRENDPLPTLDARGTLALGRKLTLQLGGALAQWPQAWPALPQPLGRSRSPLRFALRYNGAPNLDDEAALQLHRDATRFDGRFRLPRVLDWIEAKQGSPLPPLSGRLTTPTVEISGATLEGVEIEMSEATAD